MARDFVSYDSLFSFSYVSFVAQTRHVHRYIYKSIQITSLIDNSRSFSRLPCVSSLFQNLIECTHVRQVRTVKRRVRIYQHSSLIFWHILYQLLNSIKVDNHLGASSITVSHIHHVLNNQDGKRRNKNNVSFFIEARASNLSFLEYSAQFSLTTRSKHTIYRVNFSL